MKAFLRALACAGVAVGLFAYAALSLLVFQAPAIVVMMAPVAVAYGIPLWLMWKRYPAREIFKVSRVLSVGWLLAALTFLALPWQYQLYGRMLSTHAVWAGFFVGIGIAILWRFVSWRRHKKRGQIDELNSTPTVVFHYLTVPVMAIMLVMTFWPQRVHRHGEYWVALACMAVVLLVLGIRTLDRRRKKHHPSNKS